MFKFLALLIVLLVIAFFVLQKKSIPLEILKKKYTTADSKFMELDGMQVHYRMEGNGTPIVLIHGTGSALQTWDGWMDSLLAHQFNVIRLDMPAFGLTGPRSDKDYSTKMYVDFLDRFLQQLGIDTFALAGNSLGGEIAWKYALAHPSKVSNLILVDPAGFYAEDKQNGAIVFKLAKYKWMAQLISRMDTKILVDKTLKDVYEDDSKITDKTKSLYYDISMRDGNRESFTERVQQIGQEQIVDIRKIETPTLIQWGQQDKLIDISMLENFKKIKNNTAIIYENCGHVPQEEIPSKSVHDVLLFLKK
ncbi:MAG TPA: alpha/beta hydrolase [Chitinophagales bacterium]|nr:alpha/beta hydrolase [Chitinophagales bacterium]